MKISLKADLGKDSTIEFAVEGSPQEINDAISHPLEILGSAIAPILIQKCDELLSGDSNKLREKLQKEDKRLELAIPKLKKMQHEIYKEIEEVNKRQAYNIGSEWQKVMELNKLRNKYDSIGYELNSIHARRKQIKWALSETQKK